MAVSLYEFKFKGSCVLYGAGGGGVEDQLEEVHGGIAVRVQVQR